VFAGKEKGHGNQSTIVRNPMQIVFFECKIILNNDGL